MKYLLSYKIFEEYNGEHSHASNGTIISKEDLHKYNLPKEIEDMMMDWEVRYKSPYSDTFYNSTDIGWGHKPDGSLRVSDHWNFYTRGKYHCQTLQKVVNNLSVCIGQYDKATGKYNIIKCALTDKEKKHREEKAATKAKMMDPALLSAKRELKSKIGQGKIGVELEYKGQIYNGIVKRYTGGDLRIVDTEDNIIFNDNYLDQKVAKVKLYDIETGNEVENLLHYVKK